MAVTLKKLKYNIPKNPDGSFVRRQILPARDIDIIDFEWTHDDGFPADTIEKVVQHYPEVKTETVKTSVRKAIKDQVGVQAGVPDSVVLLTILEKGAVLAKALNVAL